VVEVAVVVVVVVAVVVVDVQAPHMAGQNPSTLAQSLRLNRSPHSGSSALPWYAPGV